MPLGDADIAYKAFLSHPPKTPESTREASKHKYEFSNHVLAIGVCKNPYITY